MWDTTTKRYQQAIPSYLEFSENYKIIILNFQLV